MRTKKSTGTWNNGEAFDLYLQRDGDGQWRWYDGDDRDTETSGGTPFDALVAAECWREAEFSPELVELYEEANKAVIEEESKKCAEEAINHGLKPHHLDVSIVHVQLSIEDALGRYLTDEEISRAIGIYEETVRSNDVPPRCAYCGEHVEPVDVVPSCDDDEAWAEIESSSGHATGCEWVVTRAHSL